VEFFRSLLEGRLLYGNPDLLRGPLRLIVVAKFADRSEDYSRELVRKVFEEHEVCLHTFENIEPLVEDIKKSAGTHAR
jgi:hypothetical protein